MSEGKKLWAFVNIHWVCTFIVWRQKEAMHYTSAKMSISLLIFKRIKGGRDENVSTLPYNEL